MHPKRKMGIFGGSFDPVHLGHLNLAISIKESCHLDEIIFVPANVSPFKTGRPPLISPEHRLAMLKIATAHIKEFRVIDWELRENGPSYTIDTVRKLSQDPSLQLHLILGDDQASTFHLWKEADALMRLSPPLIGTRAPEGQKGQLQGQWVNIPIFDVSSTRVRERLYQKKYCGHLVLSSVLDYIHQHDLYC
jgi:nicotinate-nucleotide adenylyltransferase